MKKGIAAALVVVGLLVVGCDDGDDPTEPPAAVEVDDAADGVEEKADEVEADVEEKADEVEASLRAED